MISTPTQSFVPIKEIRNDILILNDNSLRAIVKVGSINLSLKGEDEQAGILSSFQDFLNSLDFNIQIFFQSKKIDMRKYIDSLKERQEKVEEDLLKIQIKEYIEFIQKFTEEQNIMKKDFFIVVPYDIASLSGNVSDFDDKSFNKYYNQIMQRVSVVISGLTSLDLFPELANEKELIELYFKLFNPKELGSPVLEE